MENEENFEDFIDQLKEERQDLKSRNAQLIGALSTSGMFNRDDRNLIVYQIETDELLDKIEHYLRGDIPYQDKKGNVGFKTQPNKDLVLLNEYGVSGIMDILSRYVTKDFILSFFESEERIYEIIADIGDEMNDYFLCNYDKMGMDTPYKISKYKILVLSILHLIEFTGRRAIQGQQMKEINAGRIITQNEGLGSPQLPVKRRFSLFDRKSWGI